MPEFSIRVGTDNPGFDYEKEVATLFAIRYAFDDSVDDFWIAVNSNSVGDTDDVVLCITSKQGQKFALLIQLKHEEPTGDAKPFEESHFTYVIKDGKRIQSKEKFSVDKYSRGYRTLQSNLNNFEEEQPEIIQHLREVNQFSYILYSNKALVKNLSCLEDAACSELKKEDTYLNRLKTSNSAFYKFKSDDFKTLKSFNEDFLQNLFLFPNQTNIKGVVKLIKAEIKRFFGIHKFTRPVDFNEITKKYLEIIKLWTKGCEFQNGIKYNTLSKRDVINILSDILLSSYKFNLEEFRFSCYDCPRCYGCPQKKIWNKLVLHQDISIVQGDRLIRRFLSDYIGSEIKIKTKKQGDYWKTELDKLASNVFFDEIPNERIQVMKLCSRNDNNSITLAGVYKFMWFYQDLPLLLKISDHNEYRDILQILKISKYKLKVILIIENNQNCTYDKKNKVKHFSSLKDLLPAEQEEILKLTVQFQGRCPVLLSDITTDRMHPHIKCSDIIHILCDDFTIGNKFNFNYDKDGHIDRSISKILISFEALAKIKNEFFLIETKNEEEEILASQICEPYSKLHNQICILDSDKIPGKIAELESTHKIYHRLLFHENFLEWKESTEKVTSISKFQVISEEYPKELLYDDVFTFLNNLDINKLQIISACSGMGKSALINYISHYATFYVWIVPITLNDLVKNREIKEKLIQFKETEFFEFYASQILSSDPTVQNLQLSLMVFEDMIKSKQLLILLDGFDEISISHKSAFSTLLKFFRTEKHSVVISTREHMKSFLEAEFNVLSRSLKSFTSEEQEHFLTYFFISKICNENVSVRNPDLYAILLDFVEKLLNASHQNLGVQDEHFTEIPLHLELLANYFLKDCQSSLNKERVSLSTNFNLLDLIEKFITDKTAILCEKYGENEGTWAECLVDDQCLFALEYLFEKEYLVDLNIGNSLKKYYEVKKSSSQLIQREGILVARPMQDKMYIDFIHRTFAEYLAARWLAENVQNEEFKTTITELLKLRFENTEHFQVLFGMFDRLLVKKCTFHSSIINNTRVDDLKSQLVSNPGVWFETDNMNRTAFHILSVYAKNFSLQDLTAILNITPLKDLELNTSDDYGYSVQDYAFLAGSWTFISLLCKLCPKFLQAGYRGLEKYCILKDFLGLMEFQNRWFVLVKTDKLKEKFPTASVIRPIPLIIRVLPYFIRPTHKSKELLYLSKENFVLIDMDYQFNGEETRNSNSQPFGILLEAENALIEANKSGVNAFLEVYCGDIESKNSRRETTTDPDLVHNSISKTNCELGHAQWLLIRKSPSTSILRENLEINFYINTFHIL